MDNDRFENFKEGIKDALNGAVHAVGLPRLTGYAEGVDAAQDVDFDPEDYDAEDLFGRYFG